MSDDINKQSADPVSEEKSEALLACEKQRDEYLSGWKRAQADLINYKKDEGRRLEEAGVYAHMSVVRDLLPILDSFGFALATVEEGSPAYKGMVLIQSQLLDVLKRKGVEKIIVKRGDAFDPTFHEAMMEVDAPPDEDAVPSGSIVTELVAGYTMNGRTLRASKVTVAK